MRRLRDYQRVTVILERHRADAVVVATAADRVWLEPIGAAQLLRASLPAPAQLSFVHERHYVLLRGRGSTHPSECVEFRGRDDGWMPNQRRHARLPIALPATIAPADADGDAVQTNTIDLGQGGVLVAAHDVAPVGTPVSITIEMPDDLPDIEGAYRVVASSGRGTALQLLEADAGTAERLETMVLAVRRRIARRAIAVSAGTPAGVPRR